MPSPPATLKLEGTESMFAGDVGQKLAAESPFNRLGKETDIAPVAVFLASDDSACGELIRVSGGAI